MRDRPYDSFEEFWPDYLGEHADSTNRALHAIGTFGALSVLGAAVATRSWKVAALAPVIGYGAAWVGHFLVEQNKPATLENPIWSLRGDFKMTGMMLTGQLDDELRRLGIEDAGQPLPP